MNRQVILFGKFIFWNQNTTYNYLQGNRTFCVICSQSVLACCFLFENDQFVNGFILFLSFILYQRSLENSRSLRAKRKFTFWLVRYGNFQNWYFPYFVHVCNIIGKIIHNISRIRATPTIVPRSAERSVIFGQCGVPLFEGGTGEGKTEPHFSNFGHFLT